MAIQKRKAAAVAGQQMDLFVALAVDVPLRDQADTMERPFFSLSKTPRTEPIIYETESCSVEVRGSDGTGIATIWDADILIWAASQITAATNQGRPTSGVLQVSAYKLLRAIRRPTGGEDYARLREALSRLLRTNVKTTIRSGPKRRIMFNWLQSWKEEPDSAGKPYLTIHLADWFYQGVLDMGRVLAIDERYFDLTGGLARWLYRVARKHAGNQQAGWRLSMATLHAKSGSTQRPSDFARDIRKIVKANALPSYWLSLEVDVSGESLHMVRRSFLAHDHPGYEWVPESMVSAERPHLSTGVEAAIGG